MLVIPLVRRSVFDPDQLVTKSGLRQFQATETPFLQGQKPWLT
jgi:hypothetical protein